MLPKAAESATPRNLTLLAARWSLLGLPLLAAGCHDDVDIRGWDFYELAFRIADLVIFILRVFD